MKNNIFLIVVLVINSIVFAQVPGSLNPNFSQDGWDSVFGNNNGFYINKTIIQPDDKILICAEANFSNEGHQAVVVRYNPDGTVDTNFGDGDGMVRSKDDTTINMYTRAYGMALQSNGKIIIAGDQLYNSERIFRLNSEGTLDTSFGTDGVINMNRPNSEFIYHVAVQSDNKIIVCGKESRFVNSVMEPHVFLWRFTSEGILDKTFGNSGMISYNSTAWLGTFETYLVINDLIILPNDKIIVNQSFTKFPNSAVMLKKFNANGTSDNSFGTIGEAIKSELSNDGNYKYSSSSVQENGAIISTFTTRDNITSSYSESVFRFDSQGIIDISLDVSINASSNFPTYSKIVASGNKFYFLRKVNSEMASFDELRCYDMSGNLVADFGTFGTSIINQNAIPNSYDGKIAIANNGNIYIASSIADSENLDNSLLLTTNVIGLNPNLSTENAGFKLDRFSIYPNPSTGIVNIASDENATIDSIKIVDVLGKTVLIKKDKTSQIDISELAKGMYMMHIIFGENQIQRKIIKE